MVFGRIDIIEKSQEGLWGAEGGRDSNRSLCSAAGPALASLPGCLGAVSTLHRAPCDPVSTLPRA